ncbi:dihydropteroate synthase [Treponema phagedenis]|uniref:dihydropteroate synthase n=1 Tax=Treponema phagedenis TaxID=162 RepID=A0A0B7GYE8_TREPH|nr:dihydropteroate synthase [Treponema phagedenis]QSH98600.1 dihydropteroate synthase [Treponema phagedenis]CEM61980.1 Dihydropteroate synthase [Treponema phagedenis]
MAIVFNCGKNITIQTELPAFIQGIINVTPDSFWEGSRTPQAKAATERALRLIETGADIIDIGGESTRPGSEYVSAEEECGRIIPVIELLRKETDVPISVDTRKSFVMKEAFKKGANICNDISALEDDDDMAQLIALEDAAVILMHKKGTPATMQNNPQYHNIITEVRDYLLARAAYAEKFGIKKERIILDPGIGFGKTAADNFILVSNLDRLCDAEYEVLAGLSRKSFIGTATGQNQEKRLAGTIAANMIAVQKGARFLRVHDVEETRDMLSVLKEIQKYAIH